MGKLTEKQRRFADEYIISGTAYNAALKAGYSGNYAKISSHKLLENDRIRAYIDERLEKIKSEKVADQQEVMEFLTSVLRGQETETIPVVGKDFFEMVDNTPSIKDREKAAEMIGKRYAMWTDKQQIDGNLGVNIIDDIGEDDD